MNKNKVTYADEAKRIANKYKIRLGSEFKGYDKIAKDSLIEELDRLVKSQEELKAKKEQSRLKRELNKNNYRTIPDNSIMGGATHNETTAIQDAGNLPTYQGTESYTSYLPNDYGYDSNPYGANVNDIYQNRELLNNEILKLENQLKGGTNTSLATNSPYNVGNLELAMNGIEPYDVNLQRTLNLKINPPQINALSGLKSTGSAGAAESAAGAAKGAGAASISQSVLPALAGRAIGAIGDIIGSNARKKAWKEMMLDPNSYGKIEKLQAPKEIKTSTYNPKLISLAREREDFASGVDTANRANLRNIRSTGDAGAMRASSVLSNINAARTKGLGLGQLSEREKNLNAQLINQAKQINAQRKFMADLYNIQNKMRVDEINANIERSNLADKQRVEEYNRQLRGAMLNQPHWSEIAANAILGASKDYQTTGALNAQYALMQHGSPYNIIKNKNTNFFRPGTGYSQQVNPEMLEYLRLLNSTPR